MAGGMLPLHHAAANQAPLKVILALLEAFRQGAAQQDTLGKMPLHHACETQAPLKVISALLDAHPGMHRDYDGCTPLHYASWHAVEGKVDHNGFRFSAAAIAWISAP